MESGVETNSIGNEVRYLSNDNVRLLQQVIDESGLSKATGIKGDDLVKRAIKEFTELSQSEKLKFGTLSIAQINKRILSIAKRISINGEPERAPTLSDKAEQHRVDLNNHLFPKVTHEPVFKDEIDDTPIPKDEIEKLIQMESEKRRLDVQSKEDTKAIDLSEVPPLAPTTLESRVKAIEDTLRDILDRISKLESSNNK